MDTKNRHLRDGEPCSHRGCLSHITHPCEGCGRIGGRSRLKKCPCGKTPESLGITMSNTSKYAYVFGTCCSEWSIEFRTDYNAYYTAKCEQLATEAWNNAPRGADRTLAIVDACFHAFASDFCGDAREMAKELLNK